jgi:hypothetical protein
MRDIDKKNQFVRIKVSILGEGLAFLAEIGLPKGRIAKEAHKTPHLRAFYVVRSCR